MDWVYINTILLLFHQFITMVGLDNQKQNKTHFFRLNRRPGLKNQEAEMGRTWNSDPQLEPLAIPTTNDLIWFDGVNNYFDMKCYFQVPEKLKDNGYPEPVWKLLKASFRQEKHYYFISSTVSPIQPWKRRYLSILMCVWCC